MTPLTIKNWLIAALLVVLAFGLQAQTQPDPRVLVKQAGATTGQVLKWDGERWNPGADVDMRWHSVKTTLPYYASPEATFTAMLSYYSTRSGEIVIDTVVNITANTTISSAVRFTDQGRLNISTSITATFQSSLTAPPREQIFSGAGNVVLNPKSCEAIYPYWFGALGNGSADDYDEIQKAIATSLASDLPKIKFLSGIHNISKGLLVKKASTFVTITIEGEPAFDGTNYGTTLKATHNDNFIIGIQGGRSCVVRNLYLSGSGTSYNPSLNQVITNSDGTWATNYGRDDRYSPFAGIVFDPFANSTPTGGGYPGFSGEYTGNAGSSASIVEGVVIRYCIVALMLSPGNLGQNCSEMSFRKMSIDRCKVGIGVGSNQARSIEVLASNIALVQTGSTGLDYGADASPMPHFMNCQIGACRDMFRFHLNYGDCVATNVYAESVYRIGKFDGYAGAFTMTGCEINFTTFPETGVNDAASVLDMVQGGSFVMNGGKLIYSTYRAVEMSVSNASFVGATIWQPIFNVGNQYYTQGNVSYENVNISGYNAQYSNRILKPFWAFSEPQQFGDLLFATTNQKIEVVENAGTFNKQTLTYNSKGNIDVRLFEVATVTVSGNTATFTSANVGKYKVGDILHSYNNNSTATPSGNSKSCTFGIVSNISGSVVTCNQICAGTSSGSYALYSNELNRIVPALTATITSGSPVIAVTNKPSGFTVSSLFPVGSRVYCEFLDADYGIPNGAYVVSVSGDNITLSVNCTETATNVEIFDANMKSEYLSNTGGIPTLSNHCTFRKGDRILFPSHAYRSEAIVTRGGGAPTVEMVFKPITGSTGSRPTPAAVDAGLEYFNTSTNTNQWWDGSAWKEAGTGSVSTVSVVTANGLAGTVATATTTPAITLSTTITGMLKGNGTAISAATSGTDYEVPLTFNTGLSRSGNTVTNISNIFKTVNTTNAVEASDGASVVASGLNDVLTLNSNSSYLALSTYSDGVKQVNFNFTPIFFDGEFGVKDNSDNTKVLAFEVGGFTTATTRTATWPNKSGTVAFLDDIGIKTLNTLSGATQTFATGTSGTDFAISSSGSTHTFNIPTASATARGLVSAAAQTIAGEKTFTSKVLANADVEVGVEGVSSGKVIFQTSGGDGEQVNLTVPAGLSETYNLTLPSTGGSTGSYLKNSDGAGTLIWDTPPSGESSKIGTFQATGTAKGLSLSLDSIRMHIATTTTPGGVSVGADTWTGQKESQRTSSSALVESFRATNTGTGAAAYGFKTNGVTIGMITGDESGSQGKISLMPNDAAEPTEYFTADGNVQKNKLMKGLNVAVRSVAGNTTVAAGDYYLRLSTSTPGTYTFTLPAGAIGDQFVLLNDGSSGVILSVVGDGSDTVENTTSITIGALGETKTFTKVSSTNWDVK